MSVANNFKSRLAEFPAVLRELVEAELAAGNAITEAASCFPAPPAGAYVKLARIVTTRPRLKTEQLDFYERNSSIYSGEWTDAKRFYFVIEPPLPPEPEPDMDAIRNARTAAQGAPAMVPSLRDSKRTSPGTASASRATAQRPPFSSSLVDRFRASMNIDYEKWHDGIGYDLELLKLATPPERKEIENILVTRGAADWRDVEALALLNTPAAKRALKFALLRGNAEIRTAVMRHAPKLVSEDDRVTFLTEALRTAQFYGGLSQALDEVATFHPPEIVDALFAGALERPGEVAVHFAAMLFFIHGQTKEPFDWGHRSFFLRFNAPASSAERECVFRELCERVGVDAGKYLARR